MYKSLEPKAENRLLIDVEAHEHARRLWTSSWSPKKAKPSTRVGANVNKSIASQIVFQTTTILIKNLN